MDTRERIILKVRPDIHRGVKLASAESGLSMNNIGEQALEAFPLVNKNILGKPSTELNALTPDEAWLAGFLEGEGSFLCKPNSSSVSILAASTDKDALERAEQVAGGKISGPYKHKNPKHKQYWWWRLYGKPAHSLLLRILPAMSKRRARQINKALLESANFIPARRKNKKLLETEAIAIKQALAAGRTVTEIATEFGIPRYTVNNIKYGKSFKHLEVK